jgi:hypothetical protein
MKPRLKEDPKEWRKFALLCCAMILVLSSIGLMKKWIGPRSYSTAFTIATIGVVLAMVRPDLFRGFYRAAMTVSFRIGQVMGKVILGAFYILAVMPLGLLLRLIGKDLLEIRGRRQREQESYWKPARKPGKMEQQF